MGVKRILECAKLLFSYTKYNIGMSKTLISPSKNTVIMQAVYLYPHERSFKCPKKKSLNRLP